ncbi:MAG: hypothetical protein LBV00_02025, partial [Propionibacteriaceae bacterium]|nr:hypothetical protein [Propionibacteriaceae bacterium]
MTDPHPHEAGYRARLVRFLQAEYGFRPDSLHPAPRGFFAETWRLTTTDQTYFVKVDHSPTHQRHFRDGLRVLKILCDKVIDFVPPIILTRDGREHARFDDAVIGVLGWCEGELTESDQTKAMEYAMLARVYSTPLPDLTLQRAEFSDRSARTVRALAAHVTDPTIADLL